jgi:hypothetical protein
MPLISICILDVYEPEALFLVTLITTLTTDVNGLKNSSSLTVGNDKLEC